MTEETRIRRAFAELAQDGNAALRHRRERGLALFEAAGLPGSRDEEWKYTPVAFIDQLPLEAPPFPQIDDALRAAADAARIPGFDGRSVVFVNGYWVDALSDRPAVEGPRLEPLSRRVQDRPDEIDSVTDLARHRFAALNTALFSDGAFIGVPADDSSEAAVHLVFITDSRAGALVVQPRVFVDAGDRAAVAVVESQVGLGDNAYLCNSVTEVLCREGSRVAHYRLHAHAATGRQISTVSARVGAGALYEGFSADLGGGLIRSDLHVRLEGLDARTRLTGVYCSTEREHVDNHIRVDHQTRDGGSEQLYRGIVAGRSRAVFNGKVVVHPGADGTDASQSNANLVLNDGCEVDTKPELEIYADDVKCSHGATVGQLDETQLFYLRSRGLSAEVAAELLRFAFAEEALRRIRLRPLREALLRRFVGALPDHDSLAEEP